MRGTRPYAMKVSRRLPNLRLPIRFGNLGYTCRLRSAVIFERGNFSKPELNRGKSCAIFCQMWNNG